MWEANGLNMLSAARLEEIPRHGNEVKTPKGTEKHKIADSRKSGIEAMVEGLRRTCKPRWTWNTRILP